MRINAGAMAKNPDKAGEKCGACSSAGEHYVDIVGVTGSIPVTPTISLSDKSQENSGIQVLASLRKNASGAPVTISLLIPSGRGRS